MDYPQLFMVTNKKEISHGLDLKTGLNIFKRSKFVVTDIKHISYQLINGYYLRFVSFPEIIQIFKSNILIIVIIPT